MTEARLDAERCEAAVDYKVTEGRRWGGAGHGPQWGVRRCSFPAVTERLTDTGIEGSIPSLIRVCRIHERSKHLWPNPEPQS